jgi:hypothetical protein
MQVATRSRTNVGQSTVLVPDWHTPVYNMGIQCVITSGTPTYSIEFTLDSEDGTQTTWTAVSGLSGLTAGAVAQHTIPNRGYRINVTLGTGVVTATFVQQGRK